MTAVSVPIADRPVRCRASYETACLITSRGKRAEAVAARRRAHGYAKRMRQTAASAGERLYGVAQLAEGQPGDGLRKTCGTSNPPGELETEDDQAAGTYTRRLTALGGGTGAGRSDGDRSRTRDTGAAQTAAARRREQTSVAVCDKAAQRAAAASDRRASHQRAAHVLRGSRRTRGPSGRPPGPAAKSGRSGLQSCGFGVHGGAGRGGNCSRRQRQERRCGKGNSLRGGGRPSRPSRRARSLTLRAWNCAGLTQATWDIVDRDCSNCDILGLTEIGIANAKTPLNEIVDASDERLYVTNDNPQKGKDPAGVVGILVSEKLRRSDAILDQGSPHPRIAWMEINLAAGKMLFIVAYIPYWDKVVAKDCAVAKEVLKALAKLINEKRGHGPVVVCGDFNARLAQTKDGRVGRYTPHRTANEAGQELHKLLVDCNLVAINTLRQPPRGGKGIRRAPGAATFIDRRPADSYPACLKAATQIDFFLTSMEHQSSATSCRPMWGAAMKNNCNENDTGRKRDHAMLEMRWQARVAKQERVARGKEADLGALRDLLGRHKADNAMRAEQGLLPSSPLAFEAAEKKPQRLLMSEQQQQFQKKVDGMTVADQLGYYSGEAHQQQQQQRQQQHNRKQPETTPSNETTPKETTGDNNVCGGGSGSAPTQQCSGGGGSGGGGGGSSMIRAPTQQRSGSGGSGGGTPSQQCSGGGGKRWSPYQLCKDSAVSAGLATEARAGLMAEIDAQYAELRRVCYAGLNALPRKAARVQQEHKYLVSEATNELRDEKIRVVTQARAKGDTVPEAELQRLSKAVTRGLRKDRIRHAEDIAAQMAEAVENRDGKRVATLTKRLIKAEPRKAEKAPTRAPKNGKWGKGEAVEGETLAAFWHDFAAPKFQATVAEALRQHMPDIGTAESREGDTLSDDELDEALAVLKAGKKAGADEIPAEFYKACPTARALLYRLIRTCWRYELISLDLAAGIFIPLYKNKGSSEDPKCYRFICLLNHASKVLSKVLQIRMVCETRLYVRGHQAGFSKGKSTNDNIFALAELIDAVTAKSESFISVFIDFTAAFDSVSHKFLDEVIGEAGASAKTRAIWRAMYAAATARVRVRGKDGTQIDSDSFPIERGVVQGAVDSPWYFLLALECIFRRADPDDTRGHGIDIDLPNGNVMRFTYADDAALTCRTVTEASLRLEAVTVYSRQLGDLEVSVPKTFFMVHSTQEKLSIPKEYEIKKWLGADAHACSSCSRLYSDEAGLEGHHRVCKWREEMGITNEDSTVTVTDACGNDQFQRFYKVTRDGGDTSWEHEAKVVATAVGRVAVGAYWQGCEPEWSPDPADVPTAAGIDDASYSEMQKMCKPLRVKGNTKTTVMREALHRARLEYWQQTAATPRAADSVECLPCETQREELRCKWCCEFGVTGLPHRAADCPKNTGTRRGHQLTCVEVNNRIRAHKTASSSDEPVMVEGKAVKRAHEFKYLGCLYRADSVRKADLERRLEKCRGIFASAYKIWTSYEIPKAIKISIYRSICVSVLSFGNVQMDLTPAITKNLNHFNAKCLVTIDNRGQQLPRHEYKDAIIEQSRSETSLFNLIGEINSLRFRWLGHILRADEGDAAKQALRYITWKRRNHRKHSILQDALEQWPDTASFDELIEKAGNHETKEGQRLCQEWREIAIKMIPERHRSKKLSLRKIDDGLPKRTKAERTADCLAEVRRVLSEAEIGTLFAYCDGGADGNGANGVNGASGFGVAIVRKWTEEIPDIPTILDELWGPVELDENSPFWDGCRVGTNNTGELTGVAQALRWAIAEGGQDQLIICYDSEYAAAMTQGEWKVKKNQEAIDICARLYHEAFDRRRGGVCFLHVKGHAGNMGNEFADWLVQRGKELGLFSRLADNEPESTEQQLARRAVRDEMCARHVTATLADGTLHFGTVTTEGGATLPLAVKRKLSSHARPFLPDLGSATRIITVQIGGNGSTVLEGPTGPGYQQIGGNGGNGGNGSNALEGPTGPGYQQTHTYEITAEILETEGRCPECERNNEQPLSIAMAEGMAEWGCDTCLQQAHAVAALDTHTLTYTTSLGRDLDFDGKQEPYSGENHHDYVEAETRQYEVKDHNALSLELASSNDDNSDSHSCNGLSNVTQSSTRHVNSSGVIKTPSD